MENYKDIPGWEKLYKINTKGEVFSYDRLCNARGGKKSLRKGRRLIAVKKSDRYLAVTLANNDKRKQYFIHDLVLLTFIGPKPIGYCARHKNDDKYNNNLDNLEYGTPLQNAQDAIKNGKTTKGIKHGMVKLTEKQVLEIRASKLTREILASIYKVDKHHIWSIKNRKTWKHL